MERHLVKQGAEARLYTSSLHSRPVIIKQRFPKTYRHPLLDTSLSVQRTKAEVKAIMRARQVGVRVPTVLHVDMESREIIMERIEPSQTVRDYLNQLLSADGHQIGRTPPVQARLERLGQSIGSVIGRLHANDIIHGDLTTSNMLLKGQSETDMTTPRGDEVDLDLYMIDFGLAYQHRLTEDKAVDLYVLERALLSTHPNTEDFFALILTAYRQAYKAAGQALAKLDEVRMRGRKRIMIG